MQQLKIILSQAKSSKTPTVFGFLQKHKIAKKSSAVIEYCLSNTNVQKPRWTRDADVEEPIYFPVLIRDFFVC